jgi:hypothetical protein
MLLDAANNYFLKTQKPFKKLPHIFWNPNLHYRVQKSATRPCHQIVGFNPYIHMRNRDSSVGIAASYGMNGRGSIPGRDKSFLISTASRQAQGSDSASYRIGTCVDFPRG